ncbi:uncharacterized protein C20orf173 homolog [Castor canadensis]
MNHRWQIFVLWVFSVLILWLMATYLDPEPESAPLEKWIYSVPWHCNYLWLKFGKCGCPCGTLNCSSCHHTVREWNWFEGYHAKTTEYLMRTKVLWWLDMNSVSELGKVWKKLLQVIPRPLVHHLDFHGGICAVVEKPQLLQGPSLSSIHQHCMVFRNASHQGSWRQHLLLMLQLSDLVWTSDALSNKILEDGLLP